MAWTKPKFRVAKWAGKRRALPNTPERKLQELIETAKSHLRSKVQHPFRVIHQQVSFQKTRLSGLAKIRSRIHVLTALTNLYRARGNQIFEV